MGQIYREFRFAGGGVTGDIINGIDWSTSPLGAVATWPASLKVIVGTLLRSRQPMVLFWGSELIQFYNDAFLPSFGEGMPPSAMGQRGREWWKEIWHIIGPQIDDVMSGRKASWNEDQLVPIFRNGRIEEVFWTYGYSPVCDEEGKIAGALVVCSETTAKVVGERRASILRALSDAVSASLTVQEVIDATSNTIANAPLDIPFAHIRRSASSTTAATSNVAVNVDDSYINSLASGAELNFAQEAPSDFSSSKQIQLPKIFGAPLGPWPDPPSQAFVVQAQCPGLPTFVFGISSRLAFDDCYRGFFIDFVNKVKESVNKVGAAAEKLLVQAERRNLLMQAPVATAVVTGPKHVYELVNPLYEAMVGHTQLVGKAYLEAFPELANTSLPQILDNVYRTGEPFVANELLVPLRGETGHVTDRYLNFKLEPMRDRTGAVYGLMAVAVDITEQVTARLVLERANAERSSLELRYRSLIEATADIVWTNDRAGMMKGEQSGWASYTGQQFYEYQEYGWSSCIHPADREATVVAWKAAVETRTMFVFEHRVRRHDGVYRWFCVRAVPVIDEGGVLVEWVGLHRDIQDERTLQASVELERRRLHTLIMQTPVPIVQCEGRDFRIVLWNDAFANVASLRQLTGLTLFEAFPELVSQDAQLLAESFKTGSPRFNEKRRAQIRDKQGAEVEKFFNTTYQPTFGADGHVTGLIVVALDVTEQVRSRLALEASLHFTEQFIGILGHDLRNPLNAMLMAAQLLNRSVSSPSDRKIVERILKSGDRITRMIDQILDLARSRLGNGIPLDKTSVHLNELVTNIVEELQLVHPARTINWSPTPVTPAAFDRDRLAQVVSNLVGNALEHGDKLRPVDVTLSESSLQLQLQVRSFGNPISHELIHNIFDPYRQGLRASKSQGLGLGLFITQQIVHAHKGTIYVKSSLHQGTVFVVNLPRSQSPDFSEISG